MESQDPLAGSEGAGSLVLPFSSDHSVPPSGERPPSDLSCGEWDNHLHSDISESSQINMFWMGIPISVPTSKICFFLIL